MAYVIIWVQVDGVQGYDEDQIALVILDSSNFTAVVPMILGTPTNKLHHECDLGEGEKTDTLVAPWVNAWVAYFLVVLTSYSDNGRMIKLLLECQTLLNMMK